jgi:GNAT superfamily N-acetyltransferase
VSGHAGRQMTSDSLVIRAAAGTERLGLEALQWRAALMLDEYREALLAHPDAVELPVEHITQGRTLVAERNSVLAGFAVVLPRDDGDADLDGLFVEPAMWRQGIGTQLTRAAESLAASRGAKYLHVVAHPGALAFYDACGFAPVGETQTRFAIGLAMSKPIRATSA